MTHQKIPVKGIIYLVQWKQKKEVEDNQKETPNQGGSKKERQMRWTVKRAVQLC